MTDPSVNHLRAGVVGLGWAGRQHLAGYQNAAGVDLVGLAGMEPGPLQTLGDEYGIEHRFADWAEMIKGVELDVLSICTPPSLHAPIAIAALEAGIHVLSEKPMAMDSASASKMVDAAKASGRVLDVSFNHRRKAEVTAVKELIDKGLLGRIYYAKAGWMRHSGIPGLGSWFTQKDASGGGPMMDIGVHMLDMALHLMGDPAVRTVSASTYAEFGPRGRGGAPYAATKTGTGEAPVFEVEDLATAFIRTADDATLLLETSWAQGVGHDDMYVTLFGTEGGAEMSWNPTTGPQLKAWTSIEGVDATLQPRVGLSGGHNEAVADFVATVRGGDFAVSQGDEALTRALIVDAAYESAEAGAEIALEPQQALTKTA